MKKIKTCVLRANLSKYIACHLIGPEHTNIHRRIIGVCIMTCGVVITKIIILHIAVVDTCVEIVGMSLHGIGLIPFVSTIEKHLHNPENIES